MALDWFPGKARLRPLAFLLGWGSFLATDPPSITIMAMATVNYLGFFLPSVNGPSGRLVAVAIIGAIDCARSAQRQEGRCIPNRDHSR